MTYKNEHDFQYFGADSHNIYYRCTRCDKEIDVNPRYVRFLEKEDAVCPGYKIESKQDDFIPFGEEWEKEMMKFSKIRLIRLLADALKELKTIEKVIEGSIK
jgi:DNA-directed RNA polymerase subunit RPC12/RpoP